MSEPWRHSLLRSPIVAVATGAVLAVVLACMPPPKDGVRGIEPYLEGPADYEAGWRGQPIEEALARRNAELMDEPLDMDAAVELGLLNHPGLRGDLIEIDIAEPLLRQRTAIRNPEFETDIFFSIDRRRAERVESGLRLDITSIFDRAARVRAVTAQLESIRARAAGRIVDFITDVRRAWIETVAAIERRDRHRDYFAAAEDLVEEALAGREADQIGDDELNRLRVEATEAQLTLSRAEQQAQRYRRHLHELLGIDVDEHNWSLPARLPSAPDELSHELSDARELSTAAMARSTDLASLEHRDSELQERISVSQWRGWVPRLELGAAGQWEPQPRPYVEWDLDEWDIGPSIRLGLPLFDRQQELRDSLRSERIQVDFDARQLQRNIEFAAQQVGDDLDTAQRAARDYESELLPLRRQIADEARRQYDDRAISAVELFDARSRQLHAELEFIDIRREYWQVRADFDHLLAGGSPLSVGD